MPETSPDSFSHEPTQEHRFEESESSARVNASAPEATVPIEAVNTERHGDPTSPRELREAVFTKAAPSAANPSLTETELQIAPEPVSLWEKIKHSALNGNKQKAAAAAPSADRSSRRQNKTGLLMGGVLTVFVAGVWLLYLVSSPLRKPPAEDTTASIQQATAKNEKSLTPGLQAHPGEQQPAGDQGVTAADIRGTANGTIPTSSTARKSGMAKNDPDHSLGNIPPLPPPISAPPAPSVSNQKNALNTTALVFVRHPLKEAVSSVTTSFEPVSLRPAIALKSQAFTELPTGTRLIARLETPVTTAATMPAVATIEYNYEDKDHALLIPAGSRVFGKLEQADGQGFVGLRFQSIQRLSDPAPIPFEARAIGLNFQPLKGVVTGRNTMRRFLVRAASGIGEMTAATVGMSGGTAGANTLSNNVLIREQLMNNIGSAGDQQLQQLAYSEHRVVTLAGNTRFYLVIDHEAKQRARQDQQQKQPAPDASATNASMQAQLVELRKELADVSAKQTTLGAGPVPAGTLTSATEALNPVSPSEATHPADPPQ